MSQGWRKEASPQARGGHWKLKREEKTEQPQGGCGEVGQGLGHGKGSRKK